MDCLRSAFFIAAAMTLASSVALLLSLSPATYRAQALIDLTSATPEKSSLSQARLEPVELAEVGVRLMPVSEIRIDAAVLGVQRYFGDDMKDVIPVDLALGWGQSMRDGIWQKIGTTQMQRRAIFRPLTRDLKFDDTILDTLTNMHMVTHADPIRSDLLRVRRGDVVRITGRLVDIREGRTGRLLMASSQRFDDRGDGACEIVFLDRIERIGRWN